VLLTSRMMSGELSGAIPFRARCLLHKGDNEITDLLQPGENHLSIRVTNTEANARAVGSSHSILTNIDLCGLEGPVQIVAYAECTQADYEGNAADCK
jgi:hypothetical protein